MLMDFIIREVGDLATTSSQLRRDVSGVTYVHPSKITLAQACEDWLMSKHGRKPSTLHGHRISRAPALAELDEV
jgi:hypothetical protein